MRQRRAARLLIIDPRQRVLLFRFEHNDCALAGQMHWATPGGGVEHGETLAQAAVRELHEETGIVVDDPGPVLAERRVILTLPDGEQVEAVEHYFVLRVVDTAIATDGWTGHERGCMKAHRWWSFDDIDSTSETVWPENLGTMLRTAIAIG